jgi:two-component system, NarL family, response regulator DegU
MKNERLCSREASLAFAINRLINGMKANAMTTLLIVDDNREMRQLMKSIVSEACDEIFECEDGDEVLDAFTAHRPDWVVMDVEMKRMDGLQATSDLLSRYPQARVIIVTKHEDLQTRLAAAEAGARFLIGKEDLLSLLPLIQYRAV